MFILGLLACASDAPRGADAAPGEVQLEYIAHAAFRIRSQSGSQIVIDPYGSRIWLGYDLPTGLEADAIFITHPHYDHDAGVSRGRDFPWDSAVAVYRDPGRYEVGDLVVHGVPGKHADPYGREFGQINTIWLIEAAGVRIAHLGDNGPLTSDVIAALGRVDVLLMPIDGDYHILAESTITAIRDALKPKIVVPMHYRIPELESSPDSPSDLGPIDPWLEGQTNVRRLANHIERLSADRLPAAEEIVVFPHSPAVTLPVP